MPAKRRYNVKATKDFLVLSLICFFLGLWAVKDGWFPSEKTLKKHPLEVEAAFETDGTVDEVFVDAGVSIGEKTILASLRRDALKVEFDKAKETYTEVRNKFNMLSKASENAKENGATDESIAGLEERAAEAKTVMSESLEKVNELREKMDATELQTPSKGKVKEVLVVAHQVVEAGQPAMIINPKDHFYPFNKSLAVVSFLGFFVFLGIHILAH